MADWQKAIDKAIDDDNRASAAHTAVFKWVRPRPRGQILGGDPCLSTRVTREALPARDRNFQGLSLR
jgi:hypothetical protein